MRSLISSYPRQPSPSSLSPSPPHSPFSTWRKRIVQTKLVLCDTSCVTSSTITRHASATPEYALECSFGDEDDDQGEDDDYDGDDDDIAVSVAVTPVGSAAASYSSLSSSSTSSECHPAMPIGNRVKRQVKDSWSASNSVNTSPVQIPKQSHPDDAHRARRGTLHHHSRRQRKHAHSPQTISPSVAALLAITDISRPQRTRRRVSENNLSLSLSRGPLDLLLSPPEDLIEDDLSTTESNIGSLLARTVSADSVSSWGGESLATELCSSVDTPRSISISARRRPMRKSLELVRSPPDATEQHPLAIVDDIDLEQLGLPLAEQSEGDSTAYTLLQPFKPLRFAFKSNLTASLRALRSAAKSFSNINFPSIPADDLLTRSMLTIDPHVPYMDECRPPVTEEMPSAELRRYLNPTTNSHLGSQPAARRTAGAFSASIQMQTYKVQRSRWPPSSPRTPPPPPAPSASSASHNASQHKAGGHQLSPNAPGMRQREMRENPDFIRIAVMEMAMRRRGKLDNQKPGRARWALPPRQPSAKPYEVVSSGVPTRWIPVTY